MTQTLLDTKRQQLQALHLEVRALEDEHHQKVVVPARLRLIGTSWRYQNCYSCPQSEADYWWIYRKLVRLDGDGNFIAISFQRDKHGKLTIEANQNVYGEPDDGWERIPEDTWRAAWSWAQRELAAELAP